MCSGAVVPLIEADLRKIAPEDVGWRVTKNEGSGPRTFALRPVQLPKRVFKPNLEVNE